MSGVRTLLVVDAGGEVIAASLDRLIGMNIGEDERYRSLRQMGDPAALQVSTPFVASAGAEVMALGRPRLDERGQFNGYVLAVLDPDDFRVLLGSVLDTPDMRAELFHGDGQPVFSVPAPVGETASKPGAPPDPAMRRFLDSDRPDRVLTETSTATGAPRLLALRAIWPQSSRADQPLVVRISRDQSALYATWRQESLVRGALLFVIALLATLGLLALGRRRGAHARLAAAREAERTQAEPALRESESRLRLAQLTGRVGTFDWDIQTGANTWSPELEVMYGLAPGQFKRTRDAWVDALHPDDRERLAQEMEILFATGEPSETEFRVVWPDGSLHWLFSRVQVFRDAQGQPLRMIGVNLDITARKRAEQERERTLQDLAEAQRIAHLGSFDYDVATQTTRWSEEAYRLYGLDPAGPSPTYTELLAQYVHPDDVAFVQETYSQAFKRQALYACDHRILRPDGQVRWLSNLAYPHCDAQGELVRYTGTTLDITERREAAEQVRRSEERLRLALDGARIGSYHWTIATGELIWSDTYRQIFGLPPDAPASYAGWLDNLAPEDRERADRLIRQCMAEHRDGRTLRARHRVALPPHQPTTGGDQWPARRGASRAPRARGASRSGRSHRALVPRGHRNRQALAGHRSDRSDRRRSRRHAGLARGLFSATQRGRHGGRHQRGGRGHHRAAGHGE